VDESARRPGRIDVSPARAAVEALFAPKPVLERWNTVLLQRNLQPQSACLTSLERIVDDVMTRS